MYDLVVGEFKKGLGGYLYVMCFNLYCWYINKVVYGKMYYIRKCGMFCFFVNIKLGIGK